MSENKGWNMWWVRNKFVPLQYGVPTPPPDSGRGHKKRAAVREHCNPWDALTARYNSERKVSVFLCNLSILNKI